MSATNWADCPRCIAERKRKKVELSLVASKAYGRVSADEYKRLCSESEAFDVEAEGDTLREDYEVWVDLETGEFRMHFSCNCQACGWSFKREDRKKTDALGGRK